MGRLRTLKRSPTCRHVQCNAVTRSWPLSLPTSGPGDLSNSCVTLGDTHHPSGPPLAASTGSHLGRESAPQVGFLEGVTLCGDTDHLSTRGAGGPRISPLQLEDASPLPLILQPTPSKLPLPCGPQEKEAGRWDWAILNVPPVLDPPPRVRRRWSTGHGRLSWWLL